MNFAITDRDGLLLRIEVAARAPSVAQGEKMHAMSPGEVDAVANAPHKRVRVAGGQLQTYDARTLAQTKAERWEAMKEQRTARLAAGAFTSGGRAYNCDREAISLAAVGAMLAKAALDLTWAKTWTLADNTSATLTADQVLAVARACDDYITALWAAGRTLRAQIEAAATVAAVDAITWP